MPALLTDRSADAALRIWIAGAASGEEAYGRHRGGDRSRGFRRRVKIYATDVDEEALAEARQATYTEKQIAEVPEAMRARYFEGAGERMTLTRDVRAA